MKALETTFMPPQETVRRANPKIAMAVLCETANVVADKGALVLMIEGREAHAVKSRQPSLGRDPEEAINGLIDLMHAVLRQSLFGRPRLVPEKAKVLSPTHQSRTQQQRPQNEAVPV